MIGRTPQVILTMFVESGAMTAAMADDVRAEMEASGKQLDRILVERKITDEEGYAKAVAIALGLNYVDLNESDVSSEIVNLIPKEVAENNQAVAFAFEGNTVSVGMIDPEDSSAMQSIDFLMRARGQEARYFVISRSSFKSLIKRYKALGSDVEKALEVAKERFDEPKTAEETKEESLEEVIKGAPVSRIVSVILRYAVDSGASDIHIEPYGEETRVRYRIDGVLRNLLTLPKYIHASVISRVKVLANLKLDETRVPQDGRITETFNGKFIDFRISTLPLTESEKVVMRVLDTTRGVPKLEQLGFRKEYVDVIRQEIAKPHGMFLITGPTGSGKSTTLFTILSMKNDEGVNISTLEDPVEYFIKGVNQSQVRPEVGFTFAAGLRALLRQDPNVIMVGEIRDGETGELAIHAALTGHLLFSTLHTNDAIGVVPRLMDMHLEPFLLSATINLAIAQRLARKVCDRCKTLSAVPPEVEGKLREQLAEIPERYRAHVDISGPLPFVKGLGCVRCNNTGYAGRVACAELIAYDEELRDFITSGFPVDEVRKSLRRRGDLTLQQDALLKAVEGFTTIEEVYRITAE